MFGPCQNPDASCNVPKAIARWSAEASASSLAEWTEALPLTEVMQNQSTDLVQVPHTCAMFRHQPNSFFPQELVSTARKTSAARRAKVWAEMHEAVMAGDCDIVQGRSPQRKPCHEAQRCICRGDGIFVARLHTRLRAAFHTIGKQLSDGSFRTLLSSGRLVLRIHQRPVEHEGGALAVSDTAGDAKEPAATNSVDEPVLLQVAAMSLRPWRPTFLVLHRHTPYDERDKLGVIAAHSESDASVLDWRTVWDVIADMLNADKEITVSWHTFAASRRAVVEMNPLKQRIVRLIDSETVIWHGEDKERARRTRGLRRVGGKGARAHAKGKGKIEDAAAADIDSDASMIVSDGAESEVSDIEAAEVVEAAGIGDSSDENAWPHIDDDPAASLARAPSGAEMADSIPAAPQGGADGEALGAGDEVDIAPEDIAKALGDIGADGPEAGLPDTIGTLPPAPPPPPGPAAAVADAPLRGGPRRPAGRVAILPGLRGMLRHYVATNSVVMHCPHHTDGNCRLTRTLNSSALPARAWQGRPLALLLAWSTCCDPAWSAGEHVHFFVPSLEQRQAARRELSVLAEDNEDLRALLALERPRRPGEPEEPESIN